MFTFSSSSPTLLLNQIAAWSSPILDRFSSLLASISLLFAVVSSFQGFVVHKLQVRRRSSAPLGRPRRRGVVSLGGASVDRYCRRPGLCDARRCIDNNANCERLHTVDTIPRLHTSIREERKSKNGNKGNGTARYHMGTRIGGWGTKGLSDGQKRRVSIFLEIVTRLRLLFLDKPTSGLNSATSYQS
ncbi:uncharacterized protein LOC130138313 isoform X2 [Syzygium oleosum]|uniref:uncharacterized protein LOC130138313 isoform X2 n=1 Tax=Syzygium oleosum TaxID=219896 RepID=UPI0024BBC6A2|nr:uncharacterized protein LOC130138313 isoform X2 [Syzygium oleosum]